MSEGWSDIVDVSVLERHDRRRVRDGPHADDRASVVLNTSTPTSNEKYSTLGKPGFLGPQRRRDLGDRRHPPVRTKFIAKYGSPDRPGDKLIQLVVNAK